MKGHDGDDDFDPYSYQYAGLQGCLLYRKLKLIIALAKIIIPLIKTSIHWLGNFTLMSSSIWAM